MLTELRDALDRYEQNDMAITDVPIFVEAARQLANGKEVWLCGSGMGPMRPGKPSDLSCIFALGHFPACGRYVQIALDSTEDANGD